MIKVSATALTAVLLILLFSLPSLALEEGSTAPDFEISNLEGQKVRLSDFKGRPIILKLATTWCPTCKQQTEEIRSAEEYLKKNNVALVEVFLQDSPEMVKEYLKGTNFSLSHAVLMDDGKAAKAYNIYLIPRVLFIDENFKIRRDGSLINAHDMTNRIGKMISGN